MVYSYEELLYSCSVNVTMYVSTTLHCSTMLYGFATRQIDFACANIHDDWRNFV